MSDKATSPSTDARNVFQRKARVMARCDAIKPDKTHALKFEYISIQALSNHLRKFAAEEGLDIQPTFDPERPGWLTLTLTNVDDPAEKIVSYWPVVDGDKGYAYTTKFPLIRSFLVGDGEEADEAEMAAQSGRQTRPQPAQAQTPTQGFTQPREVRQSQPPAPPPANGKPPVACPKCGKVGTVFGKRNPQEGELPFFCANSKGGCGKGITQDEFEQAREDAANPPADEPSQLERLVDEAGVRPS